MVLKLGPGVETPGYLRVVAPRLQRRLLMFAVGVMGAIGFCGSSFGQGLQREWVRTYYNVQSKLNQPAGVTLDNNAQIYTAGTGIAVAPNGDVVVGGTSQNAEGDFDYEVIKYKPNGDEIWKVRYGSPNQGNDQLWDMAIDPNGNIILTGKTATVKISPDGAIVWATPVGGYAVAANSSYVYVTGLSDTDIVTAQLAQAGGFEMWRRVLDGNDHGSDVGEAVVLDNDGNVYVAGQEEYAPCTMKGNICHRVFAIVSYAPDGSQRWFGDVPNSYVAGVVVAESIVIQTNGVVYVYGTYDGMSAVLAEFSAAGTNRFWDFRNPGAASSGMKMINERFSRNLFTTGADVSDRAFLNQFNADNGSFTNLWSYTGPTGLTKGIDLGQDSRGNVYVTGYSRNDFSSRALFLARVSDSGQQLGVDRYNSPNAGSNFGTGLAIDANDNVYVTGYVQNNQGGSEIVTIKYSAAPKIEQKPNGAMHLEFRTNPGQPYAIEATTDFLNWQGVITNSADANGLIQFEDTNAVAVPYRFYRGNSAP